MKLSVAPAILALLLTTAAAGAQTVSPAIGLAVADAGRPEADKARDANRKPAQTLAFAGVKPGMVVAELGSGGGYYTRLLAKTVGAKGKVMAIVTPGQVARPGYMTALNAVIAGYPNISIVQVADFASMMLPEKADLFWTTENYHDFHNGPTANVAGLDKAVYNNLKRGGVFYVEDHSAAPGAGLEATSKFHRMDEDVAKAELKAAGFTLAGESELLRNPADNRAGANSETGHFVTDRFMLKARK